MKKDKPLTPRKQEFCKFHEDGCSLENYSPQQVTYMLLLTFMRDQTKAADTAKFLLDKYGSLRNILRTGVIELADSDALRPSERERLHIVSAFLNHLYEEEFPLPLDINDKGRLFEYLKSLYYLEGKEKLYILLIDNKDNIVKKLLVRSGDDSSVKIDPGHIIRIITEENIRCKNFIIAHNHPDGNTQPSESDKSATSYLSYRAKEAGLDLKAHYLICNNSVTEISAERNYAEIFFNSESFEE